MTIPASSFVWCEPVKYFPILSLPYRLWVKIFQQLANYSILLNIGKTCRYLHKVCLDKNAWEYSAFTFGGVGNLYTLKQMCTRHHSQQQGFFFPTLKIDYLEFCQSIVFLKPDIFVNIQRLEFTTVIDTYSMSVISAIYSFPSLTVMSIDYLYLSFDTMLYLTKRSLPVQLRILCVEHFRIPYCFTQLDINQMFIHLVEIDVEFKCEKYFHYSNSKCKTLLSVPFYSSTLRSFVIHSPSNLVNISNLDIRYPYLTNLHISYSFDSSISSEVSRYTSGFSRICTLLGSSKCPLPRHLSCLSIFFNGNHSNERYKWQEALVHFIGNLLLHYSQERMDDVGDSESISVEFEMEGCMLDNARQLYTGLKLKMVQMDDEYEFPLYQLCLYKNIF